MKTAERILQLINKTSGKFSAFSEAEWNSKPDPAKWSKKEILGHLIDSEYNNHVRIIKSLSGMKPLVIDSYMQEEWVKRNSYQSQSLSDVFAKWKFHQEAMVNLLNNISEDELNNSIIVNGEAKTLGFLIEDYVDHQGHHLKQIFGDSFIEDINPE